MSGGFFWIIDLQIQKLIFLLESFKPKWPPPFLPILRPPKNEDFETIGHGLLANCAKNGDDANSKLAKKTLEQANKVGLAAAYEQMAKDCFKASRKWTIGLVTLR